jgi:hypothetical protein
LRLDVQPEDLQLLLEARWQKVLEHWDDAKGHDSFLSLCFEHAKLGFAASKYREQLENESRNAIAQKRMASAALLATQVLESAKTQPSQKLPRWVLAVAVVLTSSAVGWMLFALSR